MRVGLFGQTGPYAPVALRHLLAPDSSWEIVLVVEGRKRVFGLRDHKLRQPRKDVLPVSENLGDLAVAAGIPCFVTIDVNADEAVRRIASFELDLIITVGFDRLFKRPLLATASLGGMNAHPSKLPKLRGPSPIYWAVKNGERTLAVSIHALDPREDHGSVYDQQVFGLPRRATTGEIYRIAGDIAGRMYRSLLPAMAAGSLIGIPQAHGDATRAPRPKAEDAYFDPHEWDCEHLLDFVNVAPFCRVAWTRLGDEVFFVKRAIGCELGAAMPCHYVQKGSTLMMQCRDGVAEVEVQV